MDIGTLLGSTVIATFFSGLVSFIVSRRQENLQYITAERKEWREKIREIACRLDGASYKETLKILTELYNYNTEVFINASKTIIDEYGYKGVQISNTQDDMRAPYEFVEGMFVETNTNTIHKLSLLQRIIKKMNYEHKVNITYITKNNEE